MNTLNTDHTKHYRRSLIMLGGVVALLFVVLVIISYWQLRQYTIDQHTERLSDFLALHKSMHQYIEEEQKPVFYELAKLGKIDNGFFDKRAMSFTYIARNTHHRYMLNRQKQGLSVFDYKLASNNPRNPLNQANAFESQLLTEFNSGRITPHTEVIQTPKGQEALYYATPVGANTASCMRCHSDPALAPASLIAEYGDKAGFGEQIGQIRAIISLTYPLDDALIQSRNQWLLLSGIALAILLIFYGVVAYFLSRIHRQNKKIHQQAQTDSLTGLFNRRYMTQHIETLMQEAFPCSVVLIDIDHFKKINDTFGHNVGDQVLIGLAKQLLQLPPPITTYRFGGEEFLLLIPTSDANKSAHIAAQFRQHIEQTTFDIIGNLTISVGIATQTPNDTSQTLITRADDMLYLAKQHGRNRIETDQYKAHSPT